MTGYQIQYGTKKDFSGAKKLTVKGAATVKKTIKKLDLSPTIPWFAPSIHLDADGKSVLLGHADSKGGAIYRYDIASGKVKKEMSVKTGTAYYIVPIKD